MSTRCFYYGCWNEAGHYMHAHGGGRGPRELTYLGDYIHLDGALAPRRMGFDRRYRRGGAGVPTGSLCWQAQGATVEERVCIGYDSSEYPQGQFLLHHLDNGYTAIQWWDRCQGDTRGACNSTILLEGVHTADEMLAALREHFPHVLANLEKAGITLTEVHQHGRDAEGHDD